MVIQSEIEKFDTEYSVLQRFSRDLATKELSQASGDDLFLAEATIFRAYRIYERLVRMSFLYHCTVNKTINSVAVRSKLVCDNLHTAEAIIKAGNKFLDWGNPESTKKLSNLVFEDGFPISDLISPVYSSLVDLQRFRNFVAHDSEEAENGFKKSREQYFSPHHPAPRTVGELALYRRTARSDNTLTTILAKVASLSAIIKQL